jgi:chitinase
MKFSKHLLYIGFTSLTFTACITDTEDKVTLELPGSSVLLSSETISSEVISVSSSLEQISSSMISSPIEISSQEELSSSEIMSSSSFEYTDSIIPYKVVSSSLPAIKRVVGYLPIYKGLNNIDSKLNLDVVTHLDLAFVNPDGKNGSFQNFSKTKNWVQFLDHQQKYVDKGIKIMASIGGAAANSSIYKHLMQPANRTAFIDSLMQFTLLHKLDGIDVDLEGSLVTNTNYNPFVIELSDSLKAHDLLITAAVALYTGKRISDSALATFDFLNIMAYDLRGTWTPKDVGPHSQMNFVNQNISYWENDRGISKDKIVVGVPFYGYNFSLITYELSGEEVALRDVKSLTWSNFVNLYPSRIDADFAGEKYTADGISYLDGRNTMRDKTLLSREYGGIMIWELAQDTHDDTSLMKVIVEHSGK